MKKKPAKTQVIRVKDDVFKMIVDKAQAENRKIQAVADRLLRRGLEVDK